MSRDLTDTRGFGRETRRKPLVDYKALNSVGRLAKNTESGDPAGIMTETGESTPFVDPTEERFREEEDKRRRDLEQTKMDCGELAALQQHLQRLEEQEIQLGEMTELEKLRRRVLDKEVKVSGLQDNIIRLKKESVAVAKDFEDEAGRRKGTRAKPA